MRLPVFCGVSQSGSRVTEVKKSGAPGRGAPDCGVCLGDCLFSFFDCADAYAVPRIFFEHVADAFAFGYDAVRSDFVTFDESVLN